jgi:hypothetical protein
MEQFELEVFELEAMIRTDSLAPLFLTWFMSRHAMLPLRRLLRWRSFAKEAQPIKIPLGSSVSTSSTITRLESLIRSRWTTYHEPGEPEKYPTGSTPTLPPHGDSTGEADGGGSAVIELAVSGKPKVARQTVPALRSEYETFSVCCSRMLQRLYASL